MYRQVPNLLTVMRLLLAILFFVLLEFYRYPSGPAWVLLVALGVFIIAAVSDALDGYLARRWKVESRFGRIVDPLCDKVLVVGAMMYLAGAGFVHEKPGTGLDVEVEMISGFYPWMVVVVLIRELLVTAIRSELESTGVQFGAKSFGKWKMILQSVVVPAVLLIVWFDPAQAGQAWLGWLRDGLIYATVAVTVLSGWPYVSGYLRAQSKP